MTDITETPNNEAGAATGKGGGKAMIIGLAMAVLLAGGSFWAVYSGKLDLSALPLPGGGKEKKESHDVTLGIVFLKMDPIMVSLPREASARNLRFTGQLEVSPEKQASVAQMMPRIQDVLNTYLRAVDVHDLEQPSSAEMLRAQMLRRVQVVTGQGMVRDLLITEFVMN